MAGIMHLPFQHDRLSINRISQTDCTVMQLSKYTESQRPCPGFKRHTSHNENTAAKDKEKAFSIPLKTSLACSFKTIAIMIFLKLHFS